MDNKQSFIEFLQVLGSALVQAASSMQTPNDTSCDTCSDFDQHFDNVFQPTNQIDTSSIQNQDTLYVPNVEYTLLPTEEEEQDLKQKRAPVEDNQPGMNDDMSDEDTDWANDDFEMDDEDDFGNDELGDTNFSDDEDRQGDIRYVKDAHLIYKREQDDGTFEELWIFNIGTNAARRSDYIIRDIIKGTDIPENEICSDDGLQDYIVWSVGNIQMVKVRGLPQ